MAALALLLAAAHGARALQPVENTQLSADVAVPLSGPLSAAAPWLLSNGSAGSASWVVQVPGDTVSDLAAGGLLAARDPLFGAVFRGPYLWATTNWSYATSFNTTPALAATSQQRLVFYGIKMAAAVSLNGVELGVAASQHLRFAFDVTALLRAPGVENELRVTMLPSADPANSELRWMGCSGGEDWAPYTNMMVGGHFTFSKGIWKDVAVVGSAAGSAAIELVAARTYYSASYPTAPLADDDHGDFSVNVDVHFFAPPGGARGTLAVSGGWAGAGSAVSIPVALPGGNSSVRAVLTAANNAVALWWPAQTPGGRAQARYPINVSFTPGGGGAPVRASRMIGFRALYLVTGNDTDPSSLNGTDGQSHWTMRVKVNGADVWARGANLVPMDQLEARNGDEAHRRLVRSATEGGFNMLRICEWRQDRGRPSRARVPPRNALLP